MQLVSKTRLDEGMRTHIFGLVYDLVDDHASWVIGIEMLTR
jgi:hypothetical protein